MVSAVPAPSRRRAVLWVGAVLLVAVLTVAGYLFQPWRAFVDRTAHEATPAAGRVLAAGEFTSLAHATSGRAVVEESGGARYLRIEDLDTSDGPDVRVWLSDRDVATAADAGSGRWVELGPLRGNKGSLTYQLPTGTDLNGYASVVLWCRRFSVAFGAAPLTVAG